MNVHDRFPVSNEAVEIFLKEIKPKKLRDKLSCWLMKVRHTRERARDLLQEAIEGALLSSFAQLKPRDKRNKTIKLGKQDLFCFRMAIERRLTPMECFGKNYEAKRQLTYKLMNEVVDLLKSGDMLLIDGATVTYNGDALVATLTSVANRAEFVPKATLK